MPDPPTISLADDGEHGTIDGLDFRSRSLHRYLGAIGEADRPATVLDILDVGTEVLERANRHGDLTDLVGAVERLDQESKRIVSSATKKVDQAIDKSVDEFTAALEAADGPLSGLFAKFDPTADGNLLDLFRDLVSTSMKKVTKQAVTELAEANQDTLDRLTKSVATLEVVAAAEKARQDEAEKGTAKGLDHEADVETLLGELVSVTGDGLDDVSTVAGFEGTKKGDKVITVKGGCAIVTEDKCTSKLSEAKARALLEASMSNRGAALAMLIVQDESKVPGNQAFHLIDDDKVVVVADRVTLRLVFSLFRARAIEKAKSALALAVDDDALLAAVETIHGIVETIERRLAGFQTLRGDHTKAANAIKHATGVTSNLAEGIAGDVDELLSLLEQVAGDGDEHGELAA